MGSFALAYVLYGWALQAGWLVEQRSGFLDYVAMGGTFGLLCVAILWRGDQYRSHTAAMDFRLLQSTVQYMMRSAGVFLAVLFVAVFCPWVSPTDPYDLRQLSILEQLQVRSAAKALLGLALIFVAVAVVLGVTLSKTLTRPIRRLQQAFVDVTGGDMGRQVSPVPPGELGVLTESFNVMSRDLQASHDQCGALDA